MSCRRIYTNVKSFPELYTLDVYSANTIQGYAICLDVQGVQGLRWSERNDYSRLALLHCDSQHSRKNLQDVTVLGSRGFYKYYKSNVGTTEKLSVLECLVQRIRRLTLTAPEYEVNQMFDFRATFA